MPASMGNTKVVREGINRAKLLNLRCALPRTKGVAANKNYYLLQRAVSHARDCAEISLYIGTASFNVTERCVFP